MNAPVTRERTRREADVLSTRQGRQMCLGVGEATVNARFMRRRSMLPHSRWRVPQVPPQRDVDSVRQRRDCFRRWRRRLPAASLRPGEEARRRWRVRGGGEERPGRRRVGRFIAQMAALRLHGTSSRPSSDDVVAPALARIGETLAGQQAERRGGARGDAGGGGAIARPSRSPRRRASRTRRPGDGMWWPRSRGSSTTLERDGGVLAPGAGLSRCWRAGRDAGRPTSPTWLCAAVRKLVALAFHPAARGARLRSRSELAAAAPAVEAAGWWWRDGMTKVVPAGRRGPAAEQARARA